MQKPDFAPVGDRIPAGLAGPVPVLTRAALITAAAGLVAVVGVAYAGDYKIIANPSVPVSSLSRATASSYFLKKVERWPDGTPIVPVDQEPGSPVRAAFAREVHEKSPQNLDAYWQKQVFSGRATPPAAKASDTDVIAYVRSTPGAIGYVSAGANTSGVKEIHLE